MWLLVVALLMWWHDVSLRCRTNHSTCVLNTLKRLSSDDWFTNCQCTALVGNTPELRVLAPTEPQGNFYLNHFLRKFLLGYVVNNVHAFFWSKHPLRNVKCNFNDFSSHFLTPKNLPNWSNYNANCNVWDRFIDF